MKIVVVLAVLFLGLLGAGFFFVQWANRPENVEALQKRRQQEAQQNATAASQQAATAPDLAVKKANLKLVLEETFRDNRFTALDYTLQNSASFKLEKNQFQFNQTVTKGQNSYEYFVLSKDDFEDFAAEMDFSVWGTNAYIGIVWGAVPNGDRNPQPFHVAYASPNRLAVRTQSEDRFDLGSFLAAVNQQKLRVERFGRHVTVGVNGKSYFDKDVPDSRPGRIGIYVANGPSGPAPQSLSITVKNFKIWR